MGVRTATVTRRRSFRRGASLRSAMRAPSGSRDWVAPRVTRPLRGWLVAVGVGLAVTATGLASLRTNSIALRYRLAEALRSERELREEEQLLTVELQRLRDPMLLQREAAALGLVAPERVIDIRRRAVATGAESAP